MILIVLFINELVAKKQAHLYITLVNTQFGASNIQTVLGYIWGADSKNDIGFFASALVFELRHTPIILTFICYTWILSNKEFV